MRTKGSLGTVFVVLATVFLLASCSESHEASQPPSQETSPSPSPGAIATTVVELSAVDVHGNAAPGWTVADSDAKDDMNCSGNVAADSALSDDIYDCDYISYDTCWKSASDGYALCLDDPFGRKLIRVQMSAAPTGPGKHYDEPIPLGLELKSGDKCRLRNGGASVNHLNNPDVVPFYYCGGQLIVWSDSHANAIDTSVGLWTALVGTPTGHLSRHAIATAYFVKAAQ